MLHNDLREQRSTDLRVTGELRAPRIEGFVEVDSGNVDVARVLEEATVDRLGAASADLRDLHGHARCHVGYTRRCPHPLHLNCRIGDACRLRSATPHR